MAIPVNKTDAALQVGSALLQPSLDIAGKALADWFVKKDPIQRGADLIGNIGDVTRAKVLGGLVDQESFSAPAVNIADYKRENFKKSARHNYGEGIFTMSPAARKARGFDDEAYFRSVPKATGMEDISFIEPDSGTTGGPGVETIAGREFTVIPSQAGAFEAGPVETLVPNEFARSIGINDLERAKYASEIAGWGASTAALGAAALGMNALMRGRKPRSAYSLPVQDSGGYNPNVESSMVSYENSLRLLEAKQEHWREKERWRQQAFKPGVQQYSSPPIGGYGHYPDMNFNAAQMASSIINAPTPVYG